MQVSILSAQTQFQLDIKLPLLTNFEAYGSWICWNLWIKVQLVEGHLFVCGTWTLVLWNPRLETILLTLFCIYKFMTGTQKKIKRLKFKKSHETWLITTNLPPTISSQSYSKKQNIYKS